VPSNAVVSSARPVLHLVGSGALAAEGLRRRRITGVLIAGNLLRYDIHLVDRLGAAEVNFQLRRKPVLITPEIPAVGGRVPQPINRVRRLKVQPCIRRPACSSGRWLSHRLTPARRWLALLLLTAQRP
jgi:hypothetical protein